MNPASNPRGLRALLPAAFRKSAPPLQAINAGYRPVTLAYGKSAAANTRKLTTLMGTYGSEQDGIVWVYACTQTIMDELASYPYEIMTLGDRVLPKGAIPSDLSGLLDEPNEEMTYFDFIEYKAMDEELAGNSYWLMDEMNQLGQPNALRRLRPEYTKIAVNRAGQIVGYVYQPHGFPAAVPYNTDEIIHFKRPNPLDSYYGMGTVEAIQRSLKADLAETDHVIGFFSDGARISGILTTKTLSEVQFQRFKEQFYEEYAGDQNAHRVLIAEEGTKFDPITQTPANSGIVELKDMTKDEILAGFGVPSPLLGGTWDSADHSISNAMYIFSRRMVPRARRTSERITLRLVSRWSLKYRLNATYAEPKDARVKRAGEMLQGGASINESRAEMDLPPWPEDWASTPVLPQGVAPFGYMTSGGAPASTPQSHEGDGGTGQQPASSNGAAAQRALPAADVRAVACSLHERAVSFGTELVFEVLTGFLSGQRGRIAQRITEQRKRGRALQPWDDPQERSLFTSVYAEAMGAVIADATDTTLYHLGSDDPVLCALVTGPLLVRAVTLINDETRDTTERTVNEGSRRSYSPQQIMLGYDAEQFAGVVAAFDQAQTRVAEIARDEVATVVNLTMLRGYKQSGYGHVEVIDHDCPGDHGALWLVEDAARRPLGHTGCGRVFAPVS